MSYKMEYNAQTGKLLFLSSETASRAALNAMSRLQVMTPSLQNSGKFKWDLWMHCSIFPIRYTQSWKRFHMDFLTSSGALMIEEDAVHSKEIVGFSEVHHNPVGIQFCCPCKNNFEALLYKCLAHTSIQTHTHTHKSLSHAGWSPHFNTRVL